MTNPEDLLLALEAVALNPSGWLGQSHESKVVYAILSELDERGYVVVPKEPTGRMALAADGALVKLAGSDRFDTACDVWRDMLATAPKLCN